MGNYSFVLSDELQKEFCNFKEGKAYDRNLIENLLHYYKPSILTNTSQLKRIGKDISKQLETTLRKSGFTTQSLEDLAQNTTYKIILCKDKDHYPYVNINGDKIENNLTACFVKRENRQKAIEHITALCRKAKNISIYDKYSFLNGANIELLKSILPLKELSITYDSQYINVVALQEYCAKWTFIDRTLPEYHDRYLVVDDKIEIILTSGFDYLIRNEKEFTYIVRPVSRQRFLM